MSEERLYVYLDRMEVAAARALGYVDNMEKPVFYGDQRTRDAIIANIAAIGECVTKIMDSFQFLAPKHRHAVEGGAFFINQASLY